MTLKATFFLFIALIFAPSASIRAQSNTDSCSRTLGFITYCEENGVTLNLAYDSSQWYIRNCYPNANAAEAWGAYNSSWSDTVDYPGVRDSIFNFVLYGLGLRSDDEWFCFGVPLLGVKFVDARDNIEYPKDRAILQFLMNNPRCAQWRRSDSVQQADMLTTQWNLWSDTSHGAEVFDSTVPTLQQLGLDTLLKFAADAVYPITTSSIILEAKLEGNPTASDGLLWLSIGREAYLYITVYDLLGRQVANAGYNGVFEQGTREVPLGMSATPPGTYYVRIQTANNETQTLRLLKE